MKDKSNPFIIGLSKEIRKYWDYKAKFKRLWFNQQKKLSIKNK